MKSELGERIRKFREHESLSIAAMAAICNIHKNTLINYEKDRDPPASFVSSLMKHFNLNPIWLLTGFGPEKRPEKYELPPEKEVECPVLGTIDWKRCIQEQNTEFMAVNPIRVQLFKACRKCENNQGNAEMTALDDETELSRSKTNTSTLKSCENCGQEYILPSGTSELDIELLDVAWKAVNNAEKESAKIIPDENKIDVILLVYSDAISHGRRVNLGYVDKLVKIATT